MCPGDILGEILCHKSIGPNELLLFLLLNMAKLVIVPLLLCLASTHALHGRNDTNIFIKRVLGAEDEDDTVRRAPPLADPIHDGPRFREGEIVVEGSPLDLPPGTQVLKYLEKSHMTVVKVTRGREKALVKKLREKNIVAEENIYAYASMIPNDEYFSPYQWHMQKVQASQAWDISTGEGVIVAVLDTGLADGKGVPYTVSNVESRKLTHDSCPCRPIPQSARS